MDFVFRHTSDTARDQATVEGDGHPQGLKPRLVQSAAADARMAGSNAFD